MSESTRYKAEFVPQAWVNNYAVTVDAQGETQWDATEFVKNADPAWLVRTMENGHDPEHGTGSDHDDILREDPNAPEWIREFQGPFETYLWVVT